MRAKGVPYASAQEERFPRRKEGGRESASYYGREGERESASYNGERRGTRKRFPQRERRGTRKRFPLREKKMKIAAGRVKRLTFAGPMCKIINN